ncbi:MAG: hypothetical protein WDA59_11565 [Methanofastidiosum sp.]
MYSNDLEFECKKCGSTKPPKVSGASYEFSDADGNRGIWVEFIQCVDCGFEYYITT